jgi:hypothetical protein
MQSAYTFSGFSAWPAVCRGNLAADKPEQFLVL